MLTYVLIGAAALLFLRPQAAKSDGPQLGSAVQIPTVQANDAAAAKMAALRAAQEAQAAKDAAGTEPEQDMVGEMVAQLDESLNEGAAWVQSQATWASSQLKTVGGFFTPVKR